MKIKIPIFNVLLLLVLSFIFVLPATAGELMNKVLFNDIEGVKALLATNVDVNERDQQSGSTRLLMASSYVGYEEMVKLLLANGADPNIQDKIYGSTVLIAAAGVSKETAEMLLANGADISITRFEGTSAYTTCITGILSDRVTTEMATLLLSKGADIDEAPKFGPAEGYTCLMMVARNNNPDLVNYLAANGANINAKAKDGASALSLAKAENHAEMAKLLQKLGAK